MSKEEMYRLGEEAGFVFRGKVIRKGSVDEFGASGDDRILIVAIEEILKSTDVLRGLKGKEAILVSEHAAMLEEKSEFLFFTDCASLGNQAVLRELGHQEISDEAVREIAEILKKVDERPLLERVAGADLIVTGEVVESRSLETPFPESDHDPEWGIARVAVRSVLKGHKPGREIDVLFAGSDEIGWYKSPKLLEGVSGIFVLRPRNEAEAPQGVPPSVYQATDPLDFIPLERLPEVECALERNKGGH